jgi:hypothetical protein
LLIEPFEGPTVGLLRAFDVILTKLLPQTKSNQEATAEVVMAYTSASGIYLGRWFNCLQALLSMSECMPDAFIMAHRDGHAWTSHYYRTPTFIQFLA